MIFQSIVPLLRLVSSDRSESDFFSNVSGILDLSVPFAERGLIGKDDDCEEAVRKLEERKLREELSEKKKDVEVLTEGEEGIEVRRGFVFQPLLSRTVALVLYLFFS